MLAVFLWSSSGMYRIRFLYVCLFVKPLHCWRSREVENEYEWVVPVIRWPLSSWHESNGTPAMHNGHREPGPQVGECTGTEIFSNICIYWDLSCHERAAVWLLHIVAGATAWPFHVGAETDCELTMQVSCLKGNPNNGISQMPHSWQEKNLFLGTFFFSPFQKKGKKFSKIPPRTPWG